MFRAAWKKNFEAHADTCCSTQTAIDIQQNYVKINLKWKILDTETDFLIQAKITTVWQFR